MNAKGNIHSQTTSNQNHKTERTFKHKLTNTPAIRNVEYNGIRK
jgi:hypothetical protein